MKKSETRSLDTTDFLILSEILKNSRISNNELAKRINLSQPATHARLKRLRDSGVIKSFTANLDYEKLGYELICFFQVRLQTHLEKDISRFESKIAAIPEILECHYLTGEFDYLIKSAFRNRRELELFMRNKLSNMHEIAQIITSLSLSQISVEPNLPLI